MGEWKISDIKVKRIKDFIFFVNEPNYKKELSNKILVRFQHRLEVNTMVHFTLRTVFFYPGKQEEMVSDLHVENVFEIENIGQYLNKKGKYNLPYQILSIIVNLSISHSRALLQKNLAGTVCQELMIPILDADEITKSFFPLE